MSLQFREFTPARLRPRRETLVWGALLVNTELLALLLYAILGDATLHSLFDLRRWLYPFVWINVGLWTIVRTTPAAAAPRQRRLAAVVAIGYFAVLAYAGGLVGPEQPNGPPIFRVVWTSIPPGWGPAVVYVGESLRVTLMPFTVVGYLALAYLVYATVLDATRSAVTGLVGMLSCVSCSWPVLASLASGLLGSGSGVAAAVSSGSYGLSTVVFVVTVGLLYWRPFGGE